MAGFDNEVMFSSGIRLEPSSAQDIALMQAVSTAVGDINGSGSPEGVVSANPGSIYHDRTSGNLWKKQSGISTTGWEEIQSGTGIATQYTTDSGVATPSANNINLFGQNLSGSGIQTTGSGSTVTHRMLTPYNLGDFFFQNSTSATKRTIAVRNLDTNSASDSVFATTVVNGSSADPYFQVGIESTMIYCWGIDNSDSDTLKVVANPNGNSATPSGTTVLYTLTSAGQPSYPASGWTADGILYSGASGQILSTSAGTSGQVLTSNGPGVAPTFQPAGGGGTSPLNAPFWMDDFEFNLVAPGSFGSMTFGELNWDIIGTSVPGQANSDQYHPGCASFLATTTGNDLILKGAFASINIANGTTIGQHSVKILNLSDTNTDSFKVYMGIGVGSPPDASGSGIWFSYTDTESSGNWQGNCCDFAGVTTLNTGVAVAAGTWYDLSYKCTGTTSVEFFVNGVSVGTISTDLPDSFNQAPIIATQWLTGNGGGMVMDCYYLKQELTTDRFTVIT